MFIAHRVNTISKVYEVYHKYDIRHIEIDVQITKDNEVVVVSYVDLSKRVITLSDFLKYIPDDLWINVELKRFDKRTYVLDVLKICSEFRGKRFFYSSFDAEFCAILRKQVGNDHVGRLHERIGTLANTQKQDIIGVHVRLLAHLDPSKYKKIYVWGLQGCGPKAIQGLKDSFKWVSGWIVDY